MSKEEFLKALAETFSNNVGSKLTNELASGLYGIINQMLDALKLDGENKDGKPKTD